ncbi:uncharacterized protein [Leptinotarsa decemlineata]|uniref:uncharacterized protein n=1 Tax=Leptinotarsa decemlineata TaxID=7539 RepID=UPI003D3086A2
MKFFKSGIYSVVFLAIIFSLVTEEVEGRRTILRGRKTLTRTYLRDNAVPAYVIVILVGIGEIILGAILYVIMRKTIIDSPLSGSYAVAPTQEA